MKGIVSFIVLAVALFIGFVGWGWGGLIVALVLWLIGIGSIEMTNDLSDVGKAARQQQTPTPPAPEQTPQAAPYVQPDISISEETKSNAAFYLVIFSFFVLIGTLVFVAII